MVSLRRPNVSLRLFKCPLSVCVRESNREEEKKEELARAFVRAHTCLALCLGMCVALCLGIFRSLLCVCVRERNSVCV